MPRILITGANRGIGLEFVRQYALRADAEVIACYRNRHKVGALNALIVTHENITPLELDVTEEDSIADAEAVVRGRFGALDILIHNAGIEPDSRDQSLGSALMEAMLHAYHVNAIAPLLVTQTFLPLLRAGTSQRVILISSEMASITLRDYGGNYAYCGSKAALNMTARGLAADLGRDGMVVIALDPGWVKTDMGGANAELTPAESISGMLDIIDQVTPEQNGTFLRWNGDTLPW